MFTAIFISQPQSSTSSDDHNLFVARSNTYLKWHAMNQALTAEPRHLYAVTIQITSKAARWTSCRKTVLCQLMPQASAELSGMLQRWQTCSIWSQTTLRASHAGSELQTHIRSLSLGKLQREISYAKTKSLKTKGGGEENTTKKALWTLGHILPNAYEKRQLPCKRTSEVFRERYAFKEGGKVATRVPFQGYTLKSKYSGCTLTEGVRLIQRNFSSSCAEDYGIGF